MRALGRPQDMFSDKAIQLQPIFAQWIQHQHLLAPGNTAPNASTIASYAFGGDTVAVACKIAIYKHVYIHTLTVSKARTIQVLSIFSYE